MTTTLDEPQIGLEPDMTTGEAHHTNVYVVMSFAKPPYRIVDDIYGPFHSANAAKEWGRVNTTGFTVKEIMRPIDVEEVAFVLAPEPHEPTLEDQGISQDQTQIGDYIDPNVG